MESRLILDETKYRLFIQENINWQNTIKSQAGEIPGWEERLVSALKIAGGAGMKREDSFFCSELIFQQTQMKKLEDDIEMQQNRLNKDCEIKNQYDIDAFCTQDILRERIKAIEKTYIELKCNFLNYLASIS
jgi:hypothetical protein